MGLLSDRVRLALAFALALASACLYAAALPPLAWWPLGWIALAPLCVAAALLPPGRAALVGLFFGVAAGTLVCPWLPGMLRDYFQVSGPFVGAACLGAWVVCAGLYFAPLLGWLSWALARGPVSPFAFAAAWWLAELSRAKGVLPAPWGMLGYSQMEAPPLVQIADLAGPYGVGAVLAASSALLAGRFAPGLRGPAPRAAALAFALLVAAQLAYGELRLRAEDAGASALRVGLVQGAIPEAQRFRDERLRANLERHLALTREVAREGAEIVAWPEFALDFYVEEEAGLRRQLREGIRPLGVELLAGGLGVRREAYANRRTNSVFLLRDGALASRYDKVRLVPFAEASPLSRFWTRTSDPIAAGERPRLLAGREARIGVATCSESMHPDYVGALVRDGAELLLTPSNDGWFRSRGAARQQLRAVSMRAIETRRFLLRPTSSGFSAVVDPRGRVIAEAPYGRPAAFLARVRPQHQLTPYVRLGDRVALIPLGLLLADAWRRARVTRPRGSA